MARFVVQVRSPLPPAQAGERLLDPARHSGAVPLTTVTGSMSEAGARFVARTGGRLGFDDPMVVRALHRTDDGLLLVIDKQGRVVHGRIRAQLRPDGQGTALRWEQVIALAGLPRFLDPVLAAVARGAYGATLRRILAADGSGVASSARSSAA